MEGKVGLDKKNNFKSKIKFVGQMDLYFQNIKFNNVDLWCICCSRSTAALVYCKCAFNNNVVNLQAGVAAESVCGYFVLNGEKTQIQIKSKISKNKKKDFLGVENCPA